MGDYSVFNYAFANKHAKFLMHVVEESFKQRKESKTKRNDLLDMMINAIEGNLDAEEVDIHASNQFEKDEKLVNHVRKRNLSYDDVIATALLMLSAGYETTGTTLSFILYDLAVNPNCQETLFEEIKDAGNDVNEIPYETLQTLPYLDAVIYESMRRHTIIPLLERMCTKDYKVPVTNLMIKKGDFVRLNHLGICLDPEIYPNPLEYNPDNFTKERRLERSPYSFFGFGIGPRNCLAMRFAMYEMKVCISNLVSKFRFLPCEKTVTNLEWDPKSIFGNPKGGLWIKCEVRE